jgi:pimeloyl-ACP methyl ester carboxylesterase
MAAEEGVRAMGPFVYHPETPSERIDEDIAVRLRTYPTQEGYAAQVGWVGTFESESRVSSIRKPTLIIHGDSDRYVPVENARILAGLIPDAELVILPKAGHLFITDQPEASVAAILGFVDRVQARALKEA